MSKRDDDLRAMLSTLEELKKVKAENKLRDYIPYKKQLLFHASGAVIRERLLMAGNQLGKTYSGAQEMAMHLTGVYPDWWTGRRWDHPIKAWVGGETTEVLRDTVQELLLGVPYPENLGTGTIPKDAIVKVSMSRGISLAVDTVYVRHISGGISTLKFKTYDQQRTKWQGATLHLVWFDEEPPLDIYSEGLTRVTATKGMVYVTFTPLKGMSKVVRRYLQEPSPDREVIVMTLEDAKHIPEEERQKIIDGYPEHEREARTKGVPMMGEGQVFPVAESVIKCDPFDMPSHFYGIAGIDIGSGGSAHPTAVAWLVWDKDSDIIYITGEYRPKEGNIPTFASGAKARGPYPFAWPHDALQAVERGGSKGSKTVATQYRKEGVLMLPKHATWPDGGNSVEAGVNEMLERMQTGRLKVFSTCVKWFEEFRMYHRKDGMIVKMDDDLISASRYAIMMKRYAKPLSTLGRPRRKPGTVASGTDYDVLGW